MGKSLIIGAASGYDYNQLKPWVESIADCGFTGDKVMVVGHISEDTVTDLIKNGFELIPMPSIKSPVHVARFLAIYNYLKDNYQKYEYVITTDVKDVYFQTDPVEWLKQNLGRKNFVAGSESIRYKDEPWGNENLRDTFGPYFHTLFKNEVIYNVGTLGGESEYIKDLVLNIFLSAINRPIPIVDQAVFNMLLYTQPYKSCVKFAKQKDGWACQAGTTVDPRKIANFKPLLTEEVPYMKDGIVYTSTGKPFSIVHQYDRVPEWKDFIAEKYKQCLAEPIFTYSTV